MRGSLGPVPRSMKATWWVKLQGLGHEESVEPGRSVELSMRKLHLNEGQCHFLWTLCLPYQHSRNLHMHTFL